MAYLNVKGKISHLSEITTKQTRNGGEWSKQTVVILIPGPRNTYHEVAFMAQGNTVHSLEAFREGDEVAVSGYISAREYNGRYYNDVELSAITLANGTAQTTPAEKPAPAPKKDEDLPF